MILTHTRCGLIACRILAHAYYEGTWMTAPVIAAHYNMNVRSLMPSLRTLAKVGILHSRVGGKEPGFIFARDPREISLLEVITALEGSKEVVCCKSVIAGLTCDCGDFSGCMIYELFQSVILDVQSHFSSISIAKHAGIPE